MGLEDLKAQLVLVLDGWRYGEQKEVMCIEMVITWQCQAVTNDHKLEE